MNATKKTAKTVHLRLSIRATARMNFRVQGDRQNEFRKLFRSGKEAAQAIYDYCRSHGCTAFVQIFYPKAELWREEWVTADGRSRCEYPTGSVRTSTDEPSSPTSEVLRTEP